MKKLSLIGSLLLLGHTLFAQVDVDLVTGKLQASIPLFNVTQGPIGVPVSLSYQGGGIKVEQQEGTAGMGWELGAGGAVVRELRSLPDDLDETTGPQRKGWLASGIATSVQNFIPQVEDNNTPSVCIDERADHNYIVGRSAKDTEPDVFSFFAPGLAGQFVFDGSGVIRLLSYQDLEITKVGTTPITSFTIKNNLGITYLFDVVEQLKRQTITGVIGEPPYFKTEYRQYTTPLTFTTAWRLKSITSATGDVVTFAYTSNDEVHNESRVSVINQAGTEETQFTRQEDTYSKQLSTITSQFQTVSLEWTDNRLNRVTETRTGSSSVRSFILSYVAAYDTRTSPPVTWDRRSFLVKLTEEYSCNVLPSYEFDYDGLAGSGDDHHITLGFRERKYQDLWGYYNNTSTTNIPDIFYYSGESDGERFRTQPRTSGTLTQTLSGAGRYPQDPYAQRGSLTKLVMPTGGSYEIEYQCNQFHDGTANEAKKGGGIRVSKLTMKSGFDPGEHSPDIVTNYEYLQADGKSSGRLSYPASFAFANGTDIIRTNRHMGPASYVMYERTTVKQSLKGRMVHTFSLPGMYSYSSAIKNRVVRYVDAGGSPFCESIGNLVNGRYTFPWTPDQNFDHELGLPLFITEYNEAGAKVSEKEYTYQSVGAGSTTIKGLRYDVTNGDQFMYGIYSLIAGSAKLVQHEKVRVADELTPGVDPANPTNFAETITSYTYSSTHRLLSQVNITTSTADTERTEYYYARDYNGITVPEPSDLAATAIKVLNDTRRHATPIQTVYSNVVGGTPTVTDASLVLYKDFGSGKVLPHKTLRYPRRGAYSVATVTLNGSSKHVFNYNSFHYGPEVLSYAGVMPSGLKDHTDQKSGAHYAYSDRVPIAVFTNAVPAEVVYDGFETSSSFGLNVPQNTLVGGWAGNMGANLDAGVTREKDNVQKGSSKYKASAWIFAQAATQITFKAMNGASSIAQQQISYSAPDLNKWKYVEVFLDVSSAPASFKFQISNTHASNSVRVDEVLFHPAEAEVKTTTYDTMFGKLAELDERGNAVFTTYDALGKPKYILNKNKDVVQYNEYQFGRAPIPPAISAFSSNVDESNIRYGETLTFTNAGNCQDVSSRQWKIGSTPAGNGAALTYTPTSVGMVSVSLTVILTNGSFSTTTQGFCVKSRPFTSDISAANTPESAGIPVGTASPCRFAKIFTAHTNNSGCGSPMGYTWEYQSNSDNVWYTAPGSSNSNVLEWATQLGTGYTIRCTITQDCNAAAPCQVFDNESISFFYVGWNPNDTQCQ